MSSLRKVKVGKHIYWQIVESKRVNGKPRPVVLMHLGTPDALLQRLKAGPLIKTTASKEHGAVAIYWKLLNETGILELFRSGFSSQRRSELTVGETLLLGSLHRALKPGSKRSFSLWAKKTTLPLLFHFEPDHIDSQHFWNAMNTVTDESLQQVERQLTLILKEKGWLSSRLLFFDTTNFFSFIDTTNTASELVKRGRNKQKRHDLRQFGLAQVVTREFLIPLFSTVYEGNSHDSELFSNLLTELRNKIAELHVDIREFTLVFDKGNNSKANFYRLDDLTINFVASLSPAYHNDLLAIPRWRYYSVRSGTKRVRCYRTSKVVWGKERTIVLCLSDELLQGQKRGLDAALIKKSAALTKLNQKLNKMSPEKITKEKLAKQIKAILHGDHGELLIDVEILERAPHRFAIDWSLDTFAYQWLLNTSMGIKILVTSQSQWDETDIIAAYTGQFNVEHFFKHIKNPYHHAMRPQFHWTDQKIKVHAFMCIIALLLSQIMVKKARELGHTVTIEEMLESLTLIRQAEIVTIASLNEKPQQKLMLEEVNPGVKKLYDDLMNTAF